MSRWPDREKSDAGDREGTLRGTERAQPGEGRVDDGAPGERPGPERECTAGSGGRPVDGEVTGGGRREVMTGTGLE